MTTLELSLPARTVPIHVDAGALDRLGVIVREVAPHDRVCLAVDENVVEPHGARALESLAGADFVVTMCTVVAREQDKTMAAAASVIERMLAARLERGTPVVALGGGITGDLAGFVAATYLRGVPLVQAPTTLLAMVDAAIGGKTGVNFPIEAAGETTLGKNLVGAFWQPRAVVTDPTVLSTLPARELRCGLGECVKHAIIAGDEHFAFLEANADAISAGRIDTLTELITRSAAVKIAVVRGDEREMGVGGSAGGRAVLNLGHTFAHAIETLPLDVHHGEAVAIGLVAAAACAVATDRLTAADATRIEALLRTLDLPTTLPGAAAVERVMAAMLFDKKVAGGRLRLVLPCALGRVEIVDDVPIAIVEAAWRKVGAT